jgi:C1A family cysteine protease
MRKILISILIIITLILSTFGAFTTSAKNCNCNQDIISDEKTDDKKDYALGLIINPNTDYDNIYPKIQLTNTAPRQFDWRDTTYKGIRGDWTTPARDQENCGSCWAFAPIAALETVYNLKNNNPSMDIDLSEQFMNSCGTESSFFLNGCCGGQFEGALNYLADVGTVSESCFRYKAVDSYGRDADDCDFGDQPSHPPVECSERCAGWENQIIKVTGYKQPITKLGIKNAIMNYGPVIVGMKIYQDFSYYTGGVYTYEYGYYRGNHMVVIIGWDEDLNCWICKNSWGTDWGINGFFKIRYGECSITNQGVACVTGYQKSRARPFETNGILRYFNNNLPLLQLLLNSPLLKTLQNLC